MKTTLSSLRSQRGWTLTELLFVMLIIVSLAALIAAAAGPVKTRVARYQTQARLDAIHTALAQYQSEHGGYPISEDPAKGGEVLYQALFGDFNGNGLPDNSPSDENDADVKTFMPSLQPPAVDPATGDPIGNAYVIPINGTYSVVDIWNTPFYYANYRVGKITDAPNGGGKFNPTYDLWSLGNDPDPTDDNNSMWIKNW